MANKHHNGLRFSLLLTYSFALLVFMGLTTKSLAAGGITLDGTLGPSGTLPGPDAVIPHTVGTRAGNNLFHSFGAFNIGTGESATFTGPTGIANIIGRVTGGTPSSIDGLIRSTIDGANLFLLNPSGVMFGPNARLDVMGSFHVSTADYLKFANGDVFSANPSSSSVLSVATPEAFGFLSATPAGISGNNAYLAVPDGKTLSIIAGDINYTAVPLSIDPAAPDFMLYAPAVLTAPGGRINLASIASPGELNLSDLNTGSFAKLGNITFSDGAKVSVMGATSAGSVFIRGGQMLFKDGGIDANGNPGGTVDIKGDSLHLDNYYIYAANFGETDHLGTACRIDLTNDLTMTHASFIDASTTPFDMAVSSVSGRAGDIRINARNINLGDVALDERSFNGFALGIYGYIASTTVGTGRGGDIFISTPGKLTLQNGFFVDTQTFSEGNSGNISVDADKLQITDKASIASNALGSGKGGAVNVTARDITVSATNAGAVDQISAITGIGAQTGYYSDGGTIRVTTDSLQLIDGGEINTVLYGPAPDFFATGRGADIQINAKNIKISGYAVFGDVPYYLSSIDGRVYGSAATGTGGNISVTTDTLSLFNGGVIRTGLFEDSTGGPSGNAGSITVNAKTIDIASRGQIYADSFRGTGNSGDITINAATMTITGPNNVPRPGPLDFDFTGLSTTTNAGTGGKLTVALSGNLTVTNGGGIKADTQGTGSGGAIDINAANIGLSGSGTEINALSANTGNAGNIGIKTGVFTLADGSSVTTQAKGDGVGGTITVTADAVALSGAGQITSSTSGVGNAGNIAMTLTGDLSVARGSAINAETSGAGAGGSINLNANNLALSDQGKITSSSSGSGNAGKITLAAAGDLVSSGGVISADARSTGAGDNITITSKNLTLSDKGSINASSSGTGNAGNIGIRTGALSVKTGSTITTQAGDQGAGGTVTITADKADLASSGQISSSTSGVGNAGNITMTLTGDLSLVGAAAISADTKGSGNGGSVNLKLNNLTLSDQGKITSSSSGSGSAGNIALNVAGDLTSSSGTVSADAKSSGAGGAIDLTAKNVTLTDKGTISASSSGTGDAGNIGIQTGALSVKTGSTITTQAGDQGAGGTVTITADKADLASSGQISSSASGVGKAGNIAMTLTGDLSLAGAAAISADTKGAGEGGAINLKSATLKLSDSGQITSSASGGGNAGTITVALAGDLTATSGASISADTKGAGAGGAVNIEAANILLSDKASLGAASSGSGNAGNIDIRTGKMRIEKGAAISTRAQDKGAGGTITVAAANLELADSAQISSSSSESGNAGDIRIASADSLRMRNSSITTESLKADGGNITISAPNNISILESKVTASVGGGKSTTGGNVSIDPEYLIVRNSQIVANAFEGTGGNIKIVAKTFLSDGMSVVDASSALGISGTVDILAPNNNVSGLISPLSSEFVSASALLRERCIARIREGKYSSFVVGGRDGLPIEPGNLLPTLMH